MAQQGALATPGTGGMRSTPLTLKISPGRRYSSKITTFAIAQGSFPNLTSSLAIRATTSRGSGSRDWGGQQRLNPWRALRLLGMRAPADFWRP
eukprot:4814522-Pyramimonas_sp.AAC.1